MGGLTQNMKIQPTINCLVCKKLVTKSVDADYRRWAKRKFCSRSCKDSYPRPEAEKKKISEGCKKNGVGKWMQGRERPLEIRVSQSRAMKKRVEDGLHNSWKGGITPINRAIRNSLEYKLWREAVFQRDNFTCQECTYRGGDLHADHIKPFALFPELRLAIDNGRTLCVPCHRKTPTYSGKNFKTYGHIS